MTKIHLHINGTVLFIVGTFIYGFLGYHWGLYAILLFVPDLFMLGYIINPSTGALIYNIGHSFTGPAVLVIMGILLPLPILISIGIIWICHINLDHAFGYGYKYPDAFKHTHYSEI